MIPGLMGRRVPQVRLLLANLGLTFSYCAAAVSAGFDTFSMSRINCFTT
jgi:hypothetical protein